MAIDDVASFLVLVAALAVFGSVFVTGVACVVWIRVASCLPARLRERHTASWIAAGCPWDHFAGPGPRRTAEPSGEAVPRCPYPSIGWMAAFSLRPLPAGLLGDVELVRLHRRARTSARVALALCVPLAALVLAVTVAAAVLGFG